MLHIRRPVSLAIHACARNIETCRLHHLQGNGIDWTPLRPVSRAAVRHFTPRLARRCVFKIYPLSLRPQGLDTDQKPSGPGGLHRSAGRSPGRRERLARLPAIRSGWERRRSRQVQVTCYVFSQHGASGRVPESPISLIVDLVEVSMLVCF